jgi:hypothetical protein
VPRKHAAAAEREGIDLLRYLQPDAPAREVRFTVADEGGGS